MRRPARSEVFRNPTALLLWMLTALVLWLLIPAAAQLGLWLWRVRNPGVNWAFDAYDIPPYLWHGLAGLVLGVGLVLVVCWRLRLGVAWLLVAILLAGLLLALLPAWLGTVGTVLAVLAPPLVAAALLPPPPVQ